MTVAQDQRWQLAVLAGAAVVLFGFHRSVVTTLLTAGLAGLMIVQLGATLPTYVAGGEVTKVPVRADVEMS